MTQIPGSEPIVLTDPEALPVWHPPAVLRSVPRGEERLEFWVHGYTLAEMSRWRRVAMNARSGGEPTDEELQLAQVCAVCRCGPEPESRRLFSVIAGEEARAFEALRAALPGRVARIICEESDALSVGDYWCREQPARREARERLGQALAEPELWRELIAVVARYYGRPIDEATMPVAEVIELLRHSREQQTAMVELFAPIAGLLGAE